MEGYFNYNGVCQMCAANTFKNVSGNENCTTCPSNYITQSTGATDENACGKTFEVFANNTNLTFLYKIDIERF